MTALALTISNISVRQDAEGRYSLNDLHKASGGEKKHIPSYWLSNQQTKELIAELESETTGNPVVTIEGRKGGTFVVKELVYAYAMWISPAFCLKVIRAYDAIVSLAASQPTITNPQAPRAKLAISGCLTLEQQDIINDTIADRLALLPRENQGKAAIFIRSALVTKYDLKGVKNGYKNIPSDQFTNVLNFIARLELDGDNFVTLPKQELDAMVQAKVKALPTPEAQPTTQLNGTMILRVEDGVIEQCQVLPKGAMMYNPRDAQSVKGLVMHYIPAQQLGTLIDAATQRLTAIARNRF